MRVFVFLFHRSDTYFEPVLFLSRHIQSNQKFLPPCAQGWSVYSGNSENNRALEGVLEPQIRPWVFAHTLVCREELLSPCGGFPTQLTSDPRPKCPPRTWPWSQRDCSAISAPSAQALCALVPDPSSTPDSPWGVDPRLPAFFGSTELSDGLHM